ncbi:MAG: Peptidase C45, acyl-coenzyme A:6-aminopenicillanic acid acyl-transferase [Candidatus Bipolaricaulis sibiricus]|uniref:Peptidase C45, acyl-coenzyme A:6-aminopenicillanic acid acyl-transferase n=1 Tax=Bipolaricaulis sibiricus TaxID=2501609 RepID=A0A410FSQ6_BIPS1|nr:MAG: Peptidase C45, acyl-coenzyme A:6-aminopenicillanic acid acyl-transferase [Candidatus Bipolaricaulis sibiricus]
MSAPLPILELAGGPRAIGLGHGREASDRIKNNLSLYTRRYRDEVGLEQAEVHRRAAMWLERVSELDPPYAAALRGVAAGSGLSVLDIAALNARYELFYSEFSSTGLATACTAFAILPACAGGGLLVGENWDWFPEVEGVWLRVRWGDLTVLAFTEAGIVGGKIGFNSAGIGLAVTGLLSHLDRWDGEGIPFHVRAWRVLLSSDLDAAAAVVEAGRSPCSASFLVGDATRGRASAFERAPTGTAQIEPDNGILVHANHFLRAEQLGVREPLAEDRRSTHLRQRRLADRLTQAAGAGQVSVESVQDALRDHVGRPDSVCRHESPLFPPALNYRTVLSVVMDLRARRLQYAAGPPCAGAYHEIAL